MTGVDDGDLQVVSGTGSVVYYLLFICLSPEERTFPVRSRRSTKSQPKIWSIYIQFQVTCYEKNSQNWIGRFMLAMDYGFCLSSRDKNIILALQFRMPLSGRTHVTVLFVEKKSIRMWYYTQHRNLLLSCIFRVVWETVHNTTKNKAQNGGR